MRISRCLAGVLLASFIAGSCFAQSPPPPPVNPASTTTTTGQGLQAEITSPANGATFGPCAPVLVNALATLSATPPTPVNFVYVCDLSGSMEMSPFVAGVGDQNGDGVPNTKVDALVLGLVSLNGSLGSAANVDVGLVAFAETSRNADVQPDAFFQDFTSPPDTNRFGSGPGADMNEVFRSLDTSPSPTPPGGTIGLFTFQTGMGYSTNYTAALTAMNNSFLTQPLGQTNIAFFLSDGLPTVGGSFEPQLAIADTRGTVINTFGIGAGAGSCDPSEPLGRIAFVTGGSCTIVVDPATLATALPAAASTRITALDIKINGSPAGGVVGSEAVMMSISGVDVTSGLVTGNNLIEAKATAADGTQVTAGITVIVAGDVTPPTIDCPDNIVLPANPGTCSATATFQASGDDDCALDHISCLPASGSVFQTGVTNVCCTAYDTSGLQTTCCFTVTVTDSMPPTIDCPLPVSVGNDPGQCGAVVIFQPMPADNCPGVMAQCSPASGSFFPSGVTLVTCTATDASGLQASCNFNVTVNDTESPTALCPANVETINDPGQCGAVVQFNASPLDNCPGASINCSPASGSLFAIGVTQVCCTATDGAGLHGQCCFNVTVRDTQNPSIGCPSPISVGNDPGQCGAMVTFQPSPMDNCPGVMANCSPASGSFFPSGVTQVCCTATDTSGNTAQCCFNVTVTDTENPSIGCPLPISVGNDPGQCGAAVIFQPSPMDNCPGVMAQCSPASGSFFPVGVTTVSCTATDASGRQASCNFTVTVNDTESPTANCPPSASFGSEPGQCGAHLQYLATVDDNCPGALIDCLPASGSFFPVGVTTVCCVASDAAGNTSDCCFDLTVTDSEPPTIDCPPGPIVGAREAPTSFLVLGNDACGPAPVICTPASGSIFPEGTTMVSCVATDPSGNEAQCTFEVQVPPPPGGGSGGGSGGSASGSGSGSGSRGSGPTHGSGSGGSLGSGGSGPRGSGPTHGSGGSGGSIGSGGSGPRGSGPTHGSGGGSAPAGSGGSGGGSAPAGSGGGSAPAGSGGGSAPAGSGGGSAPRGGSR